ncbi:nucleoporin complex subunit 54-domain-containing protein [Syncephalastrum racemosum]|uniref:Nucleoporin complex subunit 54-domain-containing protein n=1 Tax=Syncephalastrum racemosum TaxID=13706 RepID=A0A1X2HIP8_SYNRA|nr:nucleoporin complex subunit 54-domain-containing protein [Syncephalastrum racemosum]
MSFTFGGTAAQNTQPASSTPFSFGSTSTAPSSGSGTFTFGGNNTSAPSFGQSAPAQSSTLPAFGSATTNTNTSQPSTGFGGFGAAPSTGGGTGAFGSNTTGTTGFGGFGSGTSTAPATSTAAPLTGFGTSSFGTSQPATTSATGGFSFGNTAAKPTFQSNFGSTFGGGLNKPSTGFGTGAGGFGGGGLTMTQQQQEQQRKQRDHQIWQLLLQVDEDARKRQQQINPVGEANYKVKHIWQSLALVKAWWDPQSPYCRFKHYFYNVVPPQEVHLYQKPANHDQKAWDDAQKKNPDPSCMVPTLAVGFEDVKKRMEIQEKQAGAHSAALEAIQDKLNKLKTIHAQETAARIEEYKRRQMELTQRVIAFIKCTQVLRNKGLPLSPEEDQMRTILENVEDQVTRSEQFHGKLSQLWATLQLAKETGRHTSELEVAMTADERQKVTKVLGEHQSGIQHTIETLETDTRTVETIQQRYTQREHLLK